MFKVFTIYRHGVACNWKTSMRFFAQLCRQKYQSENFKTFGAFESLIKAFDNMFVIFFFSVLNTVLLKFRVFALKPEVCEMGGNFWLQNGLNFCKVWPGGQRPKRHILSSQCFSVWCTTPFTCT